MPQMSPLLWFSLYLYFLLLLIMIIIVLYYFIVYKLDISNKMKFKMFFFNNKW